MTPRKTFQNLSPDKQERITRIAIEEFGNKGFDGASINTMVGRMKIAKGSIFQYFGDKKGLFLFVFNRSVEMVKDYLRSIRDQSADEALPVRLNKTLSAGIQFIKNHPLLYRLYLKVVFDAKAPFRDDILISLRRNSAQYLKSLLENAKNNGEIAKHIDIDKAAFILDAVMDRFLQAHTIKHLDSGLGIFETTPDKTAAWIDEITDMICTGISAQISSHPEKSPSEISSFPYILILAAVEGELDNLVSRIANPVTLAVGNRNIISGTLETTHVKLAVTGPGILNAAQTLTALIENNRPALIIQTGCAGVFRNTGLYIGDVCIATEEIDIHSGLEPASNTRMPDELPFVLIEKNSLAVKNRYPMTKNLVEKAFDILNDASAHIDFQIHRGPFITGSTITTTDSRAETLSKTFSPCMEQMEGAAAAHVAILYDIPFIEIRAASNIVGKRNPETWNLPLAFNNSGKAVYTFIKNFNLNSIK